MKKFPTIDSPVAEGITLMIFSLFLIIGPGITFQWQWTYPSLSLFVCLAYFLRILRRNYPTGKIASATFWIITGMMTVTGLYMARGIVLRPETYLTAREMNFLFMEYFFSLTGYSGFFVMLFGAYRMIRRHPQNTGTTFRKDSLRLVIVGLVLLTHPFLMAIT